MAPAFDDPGVQDAVDKAAAAAQAGPPAESSIPATSDKPPESLAERLEADAKHLLSNERLEAIEGGITSLANLVLQISESVTTHGASLDSITAAIADVHSVVTDIQGVVHPKDGGDSSTDSKPGTETATS